MRVDRSLREAVLAAVPILRAVAVAVCGRVEQADDLVQEALVKALTNIDLVRPETNMVVWLCTFLHNQLGSDCRKPRREIADMERISMVSPPAQIGRLEFKATWRALNVLPLDQREALILVGVSGFSYKQAAEICGCPVGTAKSRVSRARARLAAILSLENVRDFDRKEPAWPISAANDLAHAWN